MNEIAWELKSSEENPNWYDYVITIDGEEAHRTASERDRDLFIAELKARINNLTVQIAGKEFEQQVKAWADEVIVMRNKRGGKFK